MLTVTQLAKRFNISRTTILYYEREGLLLPGFRSENGYRQYGTKEVERLQSIVSYRSFGLPVKEIIPLLEQSSEKNQEQILRDQFASLGEEIQKLHRQQKTIVAILRDPSLLDDQPMDKAQWTALLRSTGLDEQGMQDWHKQFEQMEPLAHQKFLESLSIQSDEIKHIREWSKA